MKDNESVLIDIGAYIKFTNKENKPITDPKDYHLEEGIPLHTPLFLSPYIYIFFFNIC